MHREPIHLIPYWLSDVQTTDKLTSRVSTTSVADVTSAHAHWNDPSCCIVFNNHWVAFRYDLIKGVRYVLLSVIFPWRDRCLGAIQISLFSLFALLSVWDLSVCVFAPLASRVVTFRNIQRQALPCLAKLTPWHCADISLLLAPTASLLSLCVCDCVCVFVRFQSHCQPPRFREKRFCNALVALDLNLGA